MGRTPTMTNVLRKAIRQALRETYTMLPGKIESYDKTTQIADVLPLLKVPIPGATRRQEESEDVLSQKLPVITDVKVQFQRVTSATGLDAHIYFPVKQGSLGMLLFSTFSLDRWLASGGDVPVDPQDPRHHDLSDAVFVPGMYPFGQPIPDLDDDDIRMVLDHPVGGKSEFYLGGDTGDVVMIPAPASKVRIGAAGASEQAILGNAFMTYFNLHAHQAPTGPTSGPIVPMTDLLLSLNVMLKKLGDS